MKLFSIYSANGEELTSLQGGFSTGLQIQLKKPSGVRDIKQAHHRQIRAWIRAAAQDGGENAAEDEGMEGTS